MGLGDLLGVKVVHLNIKGMYTMDEFFEKIKNADNQEKILDTNL